LPASQLERFAMVAKALGDPNRIEMLRLISRQAGPVCACDVVAQFDLTQPTVSHHLRILREAGLLRVTRNGLWAFYEVDPDGFDALEDLTGSLDDREAT
jgi:ArsR family transcriptional regulator